MNYTDNYNLRKPEENDPVNIEDLNSNADQIDATLKEHEQLLTDHMQASNPHNITPAMIGAETPTGAQQKANQAETNAKSYADIVTNSALNSAKNYADGVLESANSHTDQVASDLSQKLNETRIKVLDVEQDVSNISKVLTSLNPDQEAKQSVSGYGILSLPKNAANGQISCIIKGLTVTNIVKNGDFRDGLTGWGKTAGSPKLTVENGILTIQTTGAAGAVSEPLYGVKSGDVLFISFYNASNNDQARIRIWPVSSSNVLAVTPTTDRSEDLKQYSFLVTVGEGVDTGIRLYLRNDSETSVTRWSKIMVINLTAMGLQDLTIEQAKAMFTHYIDGTKSTVSAMRIRIVSEDEAEGSTAYVLAKDEDGNIEELLRLPNGVFDEIRVNEGKVTQRLGQSVINGDLNFGQLLDTTDTYRMRVVDWVLDKNILQSQSNIGVGYSLDGDYSIRRDAPAANVSKKCIAFVSDNLYIYIEKTKIDAMAGSDTVAKFKAYLNQYPITLIYQLATPIEIPIQTSGALVSYPSGTVYIEPFVADAGIYTDKMEILYQDLPIKTLEKISKVDFESGLETELDVSAAVIAEDKLSFTHPDLTSGDIVFFVYEHGAEGTIPETEISYYDSRYVIKDSVTDKFYKWHIAVADGVPSIELVEV